jgi:hypothetical protein
MKTYLALAAYVLLFSVVAGLTETANDGVIEPAAWVHMTLRVGAGLMMMAPLVGVLVYLIVAELRDDGPRRALWWK